MAHNMARSSLSLAIAAAMTLSSAMLLVASPAPAALAVGKKAPDFTTQASLAGQPFTFHLADALKKGPVVLYFFPAAATSGCTVEAHDFADATDTFKALGATVIGISADSIERLNRFSVEECREKFAVASAPISLISAYDVKLPVLSRSNRTSFVIAPDGTIVFVYSDLDHREHAERTLSAVKAWVAKH